MRYCLNGYMFATARNVVADEHPKPIRLFDLSQGTVKPTEAERVHVQDCDECQTVIAIFARQFTPKDKPDHAA